MSIPLKIFTRVCKRCGAIHQTVAKRGKFCEKCKRPHGGDMRRIARVKRGYYKLPPSS